MAYFLSVLGMVLIIEGLPYFTFPDKMKAYLQQLTQIPSRSLRVFGIVAVATGLFLIYISRKVLQ